MFFFAVLFTCAIAITAHAAHKFVSIAVQIAHYFNINQMIIGLSVVSLGTSIPEIMVALQGAIQNKNNIAIGNIIGSNIANVLLILSTDACIKTIQITYDLRLEITLLIIATIACCLIFITNQINLVGSTALIILCIFCMLGLSKKQSSKHTIDNQKSSSNAISLTKLFINLCISAFMLNIGADLIIAAASNFAALYSLKESIVGLTLVAIGTSLPEAAVSISAMLHNKPKIILGNIIGSNLFNILLVMPISLSVQEPLQFDNLYIHLLALAVSTALVSMVCLNKKNQIKINRAQGIGMLFLYGIYLGYITT